MFEYITCEGDKVSIRNSMNQFGNKGWELVNMTVQDGRYTAWFKRQRNINGGAGGSTHYANNEGGYGYVGPYGDGVGER